MLYFVAEEFIRRNLLGEIPKKDNIIHTGRSNVFGGRMHI
jgi:hypothetical protein